MFACFVRNLLSHWGYGGNFLPDSLLSIVAFALSSPAARQSQAPVAVGGVSYSDFAFGSSIADAHSHSLRFNTFCIISVCLIPGGNSDSLWYSYSPAYTAFGYQNVITMITRG